MNKKNAKPKRHKEWKKQLRALENALNNKLLNQLTDTVARNVQLEEALRELVALKVLKEQSGETEEYKVRQPRAWARAHQLVGTVKTVELAGCRGMQEVPV